MVISAVQMYNFNRCRAVTCFEECQIAPSLIGLSPLTSAHRTALQRRPVRSIHLAKARSLGFGSGFTDYPYSKTTLKIKSIKNK